MRRDPLIFDARAKAILTKIKSTKAELVFYGGMDAQAGPMAQHLIELSHRQLVARRRGRIAPGIVAGVPGRL